GVLVGAAPGVVDAHRIVGGNWSVEKRPLRLAAVLFDQLVKCAGALPELEDGPLLGRKIDLRLYLVERHKRNLVDHLKVDILSCDKEERQCGTPGSGPRRFPELGAESS